MRLLACAVAGLLVALAAPSAVADHDGVDCGEYPLLGEDALRECYGMRHGGTENDCDDGGARWWTTNSTIVLEGVVGVEVREQAACQGDAESYELEVAPGDGAPWMLRVYWFDGAGTCGIRGEAKLAGVRYGQTAPCVLDMGPPTDANAPP